MREKARRAAIAGHRMSVTHTDGRPVTPVVVDSFVISMGERYDVIVDAGNPGAWALMAVSLESSWKDTVMVPPMGSAVFDSVADKRGDWFFHCHNAYHMEAWMARVVRCV